jgi:predicted small secreted protein
VRRYRAVIAVTLALVALALLLAACGGGDGDGDGDEASTNPSPTEAPSQRATPPSPSALPQELVECYADKGYKIESPADIHSAPPEVVQECFGALHQGGGAP